MLKKEVKEHARVLDYIERLAANQGLEYDLEPNHSNQALLIAVWDAAMELTNEPDGSKERLKELSKQLLYASVVTRMGGVVHKEPSAEEMEQYRRLFNHSNITLNAKDSVYQDVEPIEFSIAYSFESDDEEVMKLAPNTQLRLFEL